MPRIRCRRPYNRHVGGIYDWISWISGGLLAIGGLALGVWALFWDRPRGRRRCPKCWYDMTKSSGLVCSECGHEAKREQKLSKTRRRLFPARMGVLLVLAGIVLLAVPRYRQGSEKIVPTTVLVWLTPELEDMWPAAAAELNARLEKGTPWGWQWRWLINRLIEDRQFCHIDIKTPDRWPEAVELAGEVRCELDAAVYRMLPSARCRAWIEPRFDGDAAPVIVTADPNWSDGSPQGASWRRARPLGLPRGSGDRTLEFDVIIERSRTRPTGYFLIFPSFEGEGWQTIHKTRVTIPLTVTGTLDDYVKPDPSLTDHLASETTFVLNNRDLIVHPPPTGILTGVVVPVVIELRIDGAQVTEWLDWWESADSRTSSSTHTIPIEVTGARRPFGTTDYAQYRWSVHVSGDPRRAPLQTASPLASDTPAMTCTTRPP